jgi:hypothetical protein
MGDSRGSDRLPHGRGFHEEAASSQGKSLRPVFFVKFFPEV